VTKLNKNKKNFPNFEKTINKLNKNVTETKNKQKAKNKTKNKTLKKTVKKAVQPKKTFEFDSGINIITRPQITIDYRLLTICDRIQSEHPKTEFSILAKGYYDENGFYVSDDYIIPEQTVTMAHVDFKDTGKHQKDGYNVVIHSHHNMSGSFSNEDMEYINNSFPCSVLYNKDGFVDGTLSFNTDDNIFIFPTDKIKMILGLNEDVKGLENIKKVQKKKTNFTTKTKTIKKNKKNDILNIPASNVFMLEEVYNEDLEDDDDTSFIVQYHEDGEHVTVNGIKMLIDEYKICLSCGCEIPSVCRDCREDGNFEELKNFQDN
jgi:hypothetical protein